MGYTRAIPHGLTTKKMAKAESRTRHSRIQSREDGPSEAFPLSVPLGLVRPSNKHRPLTIPAAFALPDSTVGMLPMSRHEEQGIVRGSPGMFISRLVGLEQARVVGHRFESRIRG